MSQSKPLPLPRPASPFGWPPPFRPGGSALCRRAPAPAASPLRSACPGAWRFGGAWLSWPLYPAVHFDERARRGTRNGTKPPRTGASAGHGSNGAGTHPNGGATGRRGRGALGIGGRDEMRAQRATATAATEREPTGDRSPKMPQGGQPDRLRGSVPHGRRPEGRGQRGFGRGVEVEGTLNRRSGAVSAAYGKPRETPLWPGCQPTPSR